MSRGLGPLCGLAFVLCVLLACQAKPPKDPAQAAVSDTLAEQLLAGARRAMGDVEQVRSLPAIATVTGPSSSFQSTVYSARDGRARLVLGQQFLAGIGKAQGWVYDRSADTVGVLDDVTRSVVQGHELHMLVLAPTTRWSRPAASGTRPWAGEPALAVEFRDQVGAPGMLYLRARDSLPLGLHLVNHTGQGPPDVDVTFTRWVEIQGVRLFRHAVFAQTGARYVYDYTELRLNEVADSMFEPPAQRQAAGDSAEAVDRPR
jgi:hypothetical protein